ncbi:hypothetical protein EG68_02408 [Paragonimus skrjabini miyazakii]|uniref:Calponin-homology (CH) domain-containing protein n=1 Tax=Paragonimus skrjabini miyazakii TaxID=59628 RepID=A0A8S9Z9T3_9TREM|nr:hypothetical protein EG68_02408 [Paragonimus skrjabini miyazakii]
MKKNQLSSYHSSFQKAMNKFKAMDKANNPQGAKPNFAAAGSRSGATSAKEVMLNWCKVITKNYEGVEIKNFGSSWSDGLAFCALIHHFYPDAFDFSTLKPENRKANFELAFDTAEYVNLINCDRRSRGVVRRCVRLTWFNKKLGNVSPLLDVQDLVRMKVPDWKCVFTQIQLYYRRFQLEEGKNCHVPPTGIIPKAAPPPTTENE